MPLKIVDGVWTRRVPWSRSSDDTVWRTDVSAALLTHSDVRIVRFVLGDEPAATVVDVPFDEFVAAVRDLPARGRFDGRILSPYNIDISAQIVNGRAVPMQIHRQGA